MASVVEMIQKLSLTEKCAVSVKAVESDYILDITAHRCREAKGNNLLAATSSNFSIQLMSRSNLASVGTLTGHTDVITGVCWARTEPHLLFSSSSDKTIRCWDCRTKPSKEVQQFTGSDETNNLFTCLDVNVTDQVLCAGLERDTDENAFILFWDRRNKELMGAYSESHQDDITQVRFHGTQNDKLVSGSTDGLVCLFDLTADCEDDALLYTFNTCSTVCRIGWTGPGQDHVYATTHLDGLYVWDSEMGDPVLQWADLKAQLKGTPSIDYIVDCFTTSNDQMFAVAGTHSGDMHVFQLPGGSSEPNLQCSLSGGHSTTVRCIHWDDQTSTLVTGGEDSMLCLWSASGQMVTKATSMQAKAKSRRSARGRNKPYKK
ncbi:WD repeat-containing protein 89-like [Dreissena polymorpha]|uniref:WD repeat-containing protein 89-like n=1 Tax=Dreissena polymorpha TaxID=45954 RepID=UPI002263B696|nr:WD repeat-containing protein 89-like [Dreissena polymorpha]XP_052233851.1 WD repeat-containing protein 89-like [Dreissena polymorpha]